MCAGIQTHAAQVQIDPCQGWLLLKIYIYRNRAFKYKEKVLQIICEASTKPIDRFLEYKELMTLFYYNQV